VVAAGGPGAAATAQQQEDWLLAGWERSQYDDKPGASLGVIINPDRVVVVTGVSSGIGAAIARVLAGRGCHVFGRRGPTLRHKRSSSASIGRCSWASPRWLVPRAHVAGVQRLADTRMSFIRS